MSDGREKVLITDCVSPSKEIDLQIMRMRVKPGNFDAVVESIVDTHAEKHFEIFGDSETLFVPNLQRQRRLCEEAWSGGKERKKALITFTVVHVPLTEEEKEATVQKLRSERVVMMDCGCEIFIDDMLTRSDGRTSCKNCFNLIVTDG